MITLNETAIKKRERKAQMKKLNKWIQEQNSGYCYCGSGCIAIKIEREDGGLVWGCSACRAAKMTTDL